MILLSKEALKIDLVEDKNIRNDSQSVRDRSLNNGF